MPSRKRRRRTERLDSFAFSFLPLTLSDRHFERVIGVPSFAGDDDGVVAGAWQFSRPVVAYSRQASPAARREDLKDSIVLDGCDVHDQSLSGTGAQPIALVCAAYDSAL